MNIKSPEKSKLLFELQDSKDYFYENVGSFYNLYSKAFYDIILKYAIYEVRFTI